MSRPQKPCFFCGYELESAGPGDKCPECGKPRVDARDVLDGSAIAERRSRWMGGAVLVLAVIAVVWFIARVLSRW